jgi:hypothetical protein
MISVHGMRTFWLIISSNVCLREFLQDLTIISHNMAFNESISASDIDPDYIRRNYKVDWNISIDHRLTFFQAYTVYIWEQRQYAEKFVKIIRVSNVLQFLKNSWDERFETQNKYHIILGTGAYRNQSLTYRVSGGPANLNFNTT